MKEETEAAKDARGIVRRALSDARTVEQLHQFDRRDSLELGCPMPECGDADPVADSGMDGATYEHFGWFGRKTHIVWQEAPKEGTEDAYIEVFTRVAAGAVSS